ncbi:MAG: type 1 glutamine amidotransferase, partial [Gaiellaceae bacterium]
MRVLSIVHHWNAASGVFADAVAARGHELVEWNIAEQAGPPEGDPGAVLVFGGAMHVDQEDRHGWLREENELLQRWVEEDVPMLGVCLGGQLLAKALGARVQRMPGPEIGWHEVALTRPAAGDPVLGDLPGRFETFQWHSYRFELPAGAVPLAENDRCLQAYRAGAAAWGLQFHAEVTRKNALAWIESADPAEDGAVDAARLRAETEERIGAWNELGRELCSRFLAV